MNERKTLRKVLSGSRNIRFADMTALVEAKPYQIRQFLRLVERYHLELEEEP